MVCQGGEAEDSGKGKGECGVVADGLEQYSSL